MLHPSYSELIDIINNDTDTDNQITSRYTIVIAAAKRARQLVDGAPMAVKYSGHDKAVSIAISEMNEGKVKIHLSEQAQRENREYELGVMGKKHEAPLSSIDVGEMDDYDEDLDIDIDEDIDVDADSILEDDIDIDLDIDLDKAAFGDDDFEEDIFSGEDFGVDSDFGK